MGFQINENRTVRLSFSLRPIVDAQDAWGTEFAFGQSSQPTQERIMANGKTLFHCKPRSRFTSEIKSNLFQRLTRTGCPSSVSVNERRKSLSEYLARTFRIAT